MGAKIVGARTLWHKINNKWDSLTQGQDQDETIISTMDIWHIINEDWVHLVQVHYHDKTKMYVDGKLSGTVMYANDKITKVV